MRKVCIAGVGQTSVGEHWDKSIRQLASEATRAALRDAGSDRVDAIYVANMLSGELSSQQQLGALVADHAGLTGIEAVRIEAACGSGGAALRAGYTAVAGGACDVVVVVGVEKLTDRSGAEVTRALASAADADFEADMGLSFVGINALAMKRYMHEYGVPHSAFAPFVMNAHANAETNPLAMLRFKVSEEQFAHARMVVDPISLLDSSPIADGAAALVLCANDVLTGSRKALAHIRSCCMATDSVALHDRRDPLALDAVARSAARAYERADASRSDIGIFEAHDAFSIVTVLSLEACGFAPRGRGVELGSSGAITRAGKLPLSTFGGLKARGHPVGASGIYQVAELTAQLTGRAGKNQIANPRLAMAQSIGGFGTTVVTTILQGAD